jgi:hypothetical protein
MNQLRPDDRSLAAGGWLLNIEPSLDAEFLDIIEYLTTLKQ